MPENSLLAEPDESKGKFERRAWTALFTEPKWKTLKAFEGAGDDSAPRKHGVFAWMENRL